VKQGDFMKNRQEIIELKNYLVTEYHAQRVKDQQTDESYYKDTFQPPLLKKPALDHKTGEAARQIDLPAEHLITNNPQAFRLARTKAEVDKAIKVGKLLNHLLKRTKMQNPNPFHLSVKTNLKRGEVYNQLVLNQNWTSQNQVGLPVWFHIPDPMIIFPSPVEYDCIPEEVIIWCKRDAANIKKLWPEWTYKGSEKKAQWLGYYSAEQRYFEAENEVIVDEGNLLGIVPFVHVYSGYGSASPDAKPEDLVVGRLRNMRAMLDAERTLFSDAMSLVHRFCYGNIDFRRLDRDVPDNALDNYSKDAFAQNLLHWGVEPVNTADLLKNLDYILTQLGVVRNRLDRELSPLFEGMMRGSSGRQDDMATQNALRRYETVMDNIQTLWSISLSQALKIIDTVPDMLPISIYTEDRKEGVRLSRETSVTKSDIAGYYDCEVELKAADVLEQDRQALMWRNAYQTLPISATTALVKGYGMTADEAEEEIEDRMKDDATINFPPWRMMMGMQLAKKQGIPMDVMMQFMQHGLPAAGKGKPEEIETPRGRGRVDSGYQRGERREAMP